MLRPEQFRALMANVSQPFYFGGAAPNGVGISAADHYEWAVKNVPWFECDDEDITRTGFFRWYGYHNHIEYKEPPLSTTVTEFYPHVGWSGTYNTIPWSAGQHIHEGRWLRDAGVVDSYLRFWMLAEGRGQAEKFTFWVAESALAQYRVTGDRSRLEALFEPLAANFWSFRAAYFVPEHGCLYTKQFAPDTDGANPRPLPTLLLANLDGGFAVDAQARRTASAAPAAARTPTP